MLPPGYACRHLLRMRRSISAMGTLLLQPRCPPSRACPRSAFALSGGGCASCMASVTVCSHPSSGSTAPLRSRKKRRGQGCARCDDGRGAASFSPSCRQGGPSLSGSFPRFGLAHSFGCTPHDWAGAADRRTTRAASPVRPVSTPRPSPIKSATSVFQSRSTWTWTNDAEDAVALEHETGNGRERGGTMNGSQRYGCAVPSPTDSPWVPLPHTCSTRTPPPRSSS